VPCTPVATNSGVHWPAHGLLRYPGTIVVEFLEPIAPGLKRPQFMRELETRVETASNALLAEGV
jgi:1-acyl-sn-glycerol-3-phosphate acyltransferase